MDLVNSIIDTTEQHLNILMDNTYLSAIIKVLLIMYACLIAPKLPPTVLQFLDNTLVKILVVVIMVFTIKKDLGVGLLIAVGFIMTFQLINKNKLNVLSEIKNIYSGGNDGIEHDAEQPVSDEMPNMMPVETIMPTTMPTNMPTTMPEMSVENNAVMNTFAPEEVTSTPAPIEITETDVKGNMPNNFETNVVTYSPVTNDNCPHPSGFEDDSNFARF
jgi:hypothetical protein